MQYETFICRGSVNGELKSELYYVILKKKSSTTTQVKHHLLVYECVCVFLSESVRDTKRERLRCDEISECWGTTVFTANTGVS